MDLVRMLDRRVIKIRKNGRRAMKREVLVFYLPSFIASFETKSSFQIFQLTFKR